jgi:hypothetical protein
MLGLRRGARMFGRMVGYAWSVAGVCLLFAVTGCAVDGPAADQTAEVVIAKRAKARWEHMIKGEFEAAYEYLSPSYRSGISFRDHQSRIKPGLWRGVEVKAIKCDQPDVCKVDVEIEFQYQAKWAGPVTGKRILSETWRKDMGEWWNVPDLR